MEIINLTEEQKECLCSELAKLTSEFKKDETIECIYLCPYIGIDRDKSATLELTLVSEGLHNKITIENYNQLYKNMESLEKFGVKIYVVVDNKNKYTISAMSRSELARTNDLFNSTILFDRTGKYTKIKEYAQTKLSKKSSHIYNYENLAEFFSPVTKEIQYRCKKLGQKN